MDKVSGNSPARRRRSRFRAWFIPAAIRLLFGSYLRFRYEQSDRLPDVPCVVCFNHPNWVDPFLLVGAWPGRRFVYIYGPKEQDMTVGWRNRLIAWGERGVPFKPGKNDLLDATRRAVAVLAEGDILAIAGEGRLSDREGEIASLSHGPAFFALRARVPVVPVGICGSRWLHFGKRVRLRVGRPIPTDGLRADRSTIAFVTGQIEVELRALIADCPDSPPAGPLGRWLSELFNERPWLEEGLSPPPAARGASHR